MTGPYALVKPELLVWARTSAGLSLEAVAKRMNVAANRVANWETGSEQLTITQLRKVAEICKRAREGWSSARTAREPLLAHQATDLALARS